MALLIILCSCAQPASMGPRSAAADLVRQGGVLIVAALSDIVPGGPMDVLAARLARRGQKPAFVSHEAVPDRTLEEYQAVLMYVHPPLSHEAAASLIAYANQGGRLIVLHHGIASAKLSTPEWLAFVGIDIPSHKHPVHPWQVTHDATFTMVNLAPGHYVTSHRVEYERLAHYVSPERHELRGQYPAFDLPDTEIYHNQRVVDDGDRHGRKRTYLFGYRHEQEGHPLRMEDTAGWMMPVENNGLVFYLQAGHAAHDFQHPSFFQIILNCIDWHPGAKPAGVDPLVEQAAVN